ncbi:hypothetical protein V6Z93_004436 [Aspergillus fumigatus]
MAVNDRDKLPMVGIEPTAQDGATVLAIQHALSTHHPDCANMLISIPSVWVFRGIQQPTPAHESMRELVVAGV